MITHPALPGRAVGRCARRGSTSTSSPRRSRCSRSPTGTSACAATSTRASPHALPGTYLNGVLRDAAAALRRGRLRLPGVRPDAGQRHRRQAHPAARRRRAVRRPLRHACAAHERVLDLRAGVLRRAREWVSPAGTPVEVALDAARLVRAAGGGGDPVRGRGARRPGPDRRAVRAGRQRAHARRPDDPRAAAALRRRWSASITATTSCGVVLVHSHARERAADGGRDRPRVRRPGRHAEHVGQRGGPRRGSTVTAELAAGAAPADREVPRLRLVEPALAAGAARPGRRRARGGAAHRLGRPAGRPARVPRRRSGTARRRRGRRRPRAAAGGAVRALPRAAGRRARRAAGDPGQGPDRPRLRRPHLLGHGDASCCPC